MKALREWAHQRPPSDLIHRVARTAIPLFEGRKWGKGSEDPDDDERVFLVEGGRKPDAGRQGGKPARVKGPKVLIAPVSELPGRRSSKSISPSSTPSSMRRAPLESLPQPVHEHPEVAACEGIALGRVLPGGRWEDKLPARANVFVGRWRTVNTEHYDDFLKMFNMSWCGCGERGVWVFGHGGWCPCVGSDQGLRLVNGQRV